MVMNVSHISQNDMFINSEYTPLREVLLYIPKSSIVIDSPEDYLLLHKIDFEILYQELNTLAEIYERHGVNVHLIPHTELSDDECTMLINMMYTRDLFFMTPGGAILSRMGVAIRRGEVKYAHRQLEEVLDIPLLGRIEGDGIFEGADALWVNESTVMIGVGNRTNTKGFEQVKKILQQFGVNTIAVPFSQTFPQHLLGAVQFVDKNVAIIRNQLLHPSVIQILKSNGLKFIHVPENKEVQKRQAMNIVTIGPRKVVMPKDCPTTKRFFTNAGIKVIATVDITQLLNGGGGLACATGILRRQLV